MEQLSLAMGEADRIKQKYPGRIPIFVTKAPSAKDIPDIPKHKFLAPANLTIGQFVYIIRRQIKLPPERALFLFINNTLPTSSTLLSEIYATYKHTDGALRMVYTSESTFGAFNLMFSF